MSTPYSIQCRFPISISNIKLLLSTMKKCHLVTSNAIAASPNSRAESVSLWLPAHSPKPWPECMGLGSICKLKPKPYFHYLCQGTLKQCKNHRSQHAVFHGCRGLIWRTCLLETNHDKTGHHIFLVRLLFFFDQNLISLHMCPMRDFEPVIATEDQSWHYAIFEVQVCKAAVSWCYWNSVRGSSWRSGSQTLLGIMHNKL